MVELRQVRQVFKTRRGDVAALDGVDLTIEPGQFTVIRGPSGSGKTTLLLTLGGMLHPTGGQIVIDGQNLYDRSVADRARFRAEHIGFVFQMFHLVPYLSVLENVLLPNGAHPQPASREAARALLDRLGMTPREHHKPAQLSAGERQRVALARAMLNQPKLILADEPTGNLDPDNAAGVVQGLSAFHREGGTVIVVTHGTAVDPHADKIIQLRDGRIDAAA